MTINNVDLFAISFWLVFAVAVIALTPVTSVKCRKYLLSIIHLSFLAILLKGLFWFPVIAVMLLWGLFSLFYSRNNKILLFAGLFFFALFIFHKLPTLLPNLGISAANPLLAAIGYSYIFLRIIDLLRTLYQNPQPVPDFFSLINYLLPFHMLAAGPIQSYRQFVEQPPVPPALNLEQVLTAVERIAHGLFKKFVLAFLIDHIFLTGFHAGGWYFVLEVQLFFLWLYLDFSAYSDIAVGMGTLMGVATPENFDRPYLARNIIVFWERWHISLSLFIRDNIFMPMQIWLMRQSKGKRVLWNSSLSFIAAFFICGLWHQFSLPYISWGLLQAFGLVVCNLYKFYFSKWLGKEKWKSYRQNRLIHWSMVLLTYEFNAFAIMVIAYPWGNA